MTDRVQILDQNNQPLFPGVFSVIDVEVTESSRAFTQPLEDNTVIIEHKVIDPVEVKLSVLLNSEEYQSGYAFFKTLFIASSEVVIKTKATLYERMILIDMPHDENAEVFDTIILNLSFREVIEASSITTSFVPANADDSSTVNVGRTVPVATPDFDVGELQELFGF